MTDTAASGQTCLKLKKHDMKINTRMYENECDSVVVAFKAAQLYTTMLRNKKKILWIINAFFCLKTFEVLFHVSLAFIFHFFNLRLFRLYKKAQVFELILKSDQFHFQIQKRKAKNFIHNLAQRKLWIQDTFMFQERKQAINFNEYVFSISIKYWCTPDTDS